jgi:beta-phosphoglucomutase-like phosphatase (HAD superfamily)
MPAKSLDAVCFDLDGVLIDSERAWDVARRGGHAARGWLRIARRADARRARQPPRAALITIYVELAASMPGLNKTPEEGDA